MLTMDWKLRLESDVADYYENKLIEKYYDIEIVYTAYPQRVNGHVPSAVLNFVGSELAKRIKDFKKYLEFYEYLWTKKGEEGQAIFVKLMKSAIKKDQDFFVDYLIKMLEKSDDAEIYHLILRKILTKVIEKNTKKYLRELLFLLKNKNIDIQEEIIKLFLKIFKKNGSLLKKIFPKLQRRWYNLTPDQVKPFISLLKGIYKIDKKFYLEVYEENRNSREPSVVAILGKSIRCYDKKIEKLVITWSESGNSILKSEGKHAMKLVKKFKKKEEKKKNG